MSHLTYPQLARRRGWSGRVVLAFVVAEDGSVRSIHVKEGSGHTLLDNSAVETVKGVAPFPKPPVAAEIIMPVVFRLE
ncbi:energy transducer TonB [Trichlorobacter lovleyi]